MPDARAQRDRLWFTKRIALAHRIIRRASEEDLEGGQGPNGWEQILNHQLVILPEPTNPASNAMRRIQLAISPHARRKSGKDRRVHFHFPGPLLDHHQCRARRRYGLSLSQSVNDPLEGNPELVRVDQVSDLALVSCREFVCHRVAQLLEPLAQPIVIDRHGEPGETTSTEGSSKQRTSTR